MSTKTIPAQTIKTCDGCGVTMDAQTSRQEGKLTINAHAFALHKVGLADTAVREALAAPATAQADSVPAPVPPPECETEAEKRAFAFGWFKALESERMKADSVQEDAALLDFIERHPEMSLRHRKGKWAFIGFTNYEYDLHESLRDAVVAARKQGANP